jgi:hypothetical protein
MNLESVFKLVLGSACIYGVVAACGSSSGSFLGSDGGKKDGVSPVPDAMADIDESGSRLKVQYFKGSDGSKTFNGMYDTQLKHPCTFATASDGTSRCLPTGLGTTSNTGYYSDSHCSQPVLNIPTVCTTPPPYISTLGTDCSGATTVHIYPAGATFTPATDLYIGTGSGATGTCTAFPSKDIKAGTWYSAGTELPPSTFVQGTLTND